MSFISFSNVKELFFPPLFFFTGVNEFTGKDITHDWMEFNLQFQKGL